LYLNEGEWFKVDLCLPIAEKGFMPKLVILDSGIFSKDVLPKFIKIFKGSEVLVLKATSPSIPKHEPFTPSSYYYLAEIDFEISQHSNYRITIFEDSREGRYGLAIGYTEVFGSNERLLIPIDIISAYEWEVQQTGFTLDPLFPTLVEGILAIFWLKKELLENLRVRKTSIEGLIYIGNGFIITIQMLIALLVVQLDFSVFPTLIFAVLPVLLGFLIIIYDFLGLVTWLGLLVGSILEIILVLSSNKKIGGWIN
jgi:hypothetical protein